MIGVSHHAWERAAERMGRPLRSEEWRAVLLQVLDRKAVLLSRQDDMGEIYLVAVGTVSMRIVWNPFQACVVTVLPTDTTSLSAAEEALRNGPIRASMRRFARYSRGTLLPGGTEWVKP